MENICNTCKMCNKKVDLNNGFEESINKCQNWLDTCTIEESESIFSSSDCCTSGSVISDSTDNSALESGFKFQNSGVIMSNNILCENVNKHLEINNIFKKESNKYENVNIYKSKKIHLGDITYINGPIIVNHPSKNYDLPPNIENNKDQPPIFPGIISRRNWLAQPPENERQLLSEPAKYVAVCHTASEEGFTQAENTLLVRLTQTFHIESRQWDDIAYNFLIGSDGNVYEGRNWGIRGAFAHKYNKISIGICFIGCFLRHLPPAVSIQKAKELILHGVKIGAIAKDYGVIGHCQCSSVESPGRSLFEEIKTWDHWDSTISVSEPSELV